jgi:hypothetical protein
MLLNVLREKNFNVRYARFPTQYVTKPMPNYGHAFGLRVKAMLLAQLVQAVLCEGVFNY